MHSFFPLQKFITDNYASFYQDNWSKTWRKETQGSWQRIFSYSLNKHLALSKEQPLFRAGLVLSKEYRTDIGDCRKTSHVIFLGSLGSGPITQQEDWNFMASRSSMSHANMTKTQYKLYKQHLLWCVCVSCHLSLSKARRTVHPDSPWREWCKYHFCYPLHSALWASSFGWRLLIIFSNV